MSSSKDKQSLNVSESQAQTADTFGAYWSQEMLLNTRQESEYSRQWYIRYGSEIPAKIEEIFASRSGVISVLDAGCGMGVSAGGLLREFWPRTDYFGVDVSDAVERAKKYLATYDAHRLRFLRGDFAQLPPDTGAFDFIIALGSLHHSDSVERSLKALSRLVKPDGSILLWIINEQKPVRALTDEYLRGYFQKFPIDQVLNQMLSYSKLSQKIGEAIGEIQLDVPEDVPCLGLKAGPIRLQTFVYDYLIKAFYHPDYSPERTNIHHFDWFYPKYYHQTNQNQMRQYAAAAGLEIESLVERSNGLTCVARRKG